MTDIQKLKALAEAATPGPWCWDKGENPRPNTYGIATDADEEQMVVDQEHGIELKEDAYFIAAANPAAVLELIAEIERLKVDCANAMDDACLLAGERDQLKTESEALRESNDKLTRRNEMLEQNVKVMTETHVLYTWLRKKVDQPSNEFVAVHMNIGHDWTPVHDLDRDLRGMIEREEP